jgi:hypothetical protein
MNLTCGDRWKTTPLGSNQQKSIDINYFVKTCEGTPTVAAPHYLVGLAFPFGTPTVRKVSREKSAWRQQFQKSSTLEPPIPLAHANVFQKAFSKNSRRQGFCVAGRVFDLPAQIFAASTLTAYSGQHRRQKKKAGSVVALGHMRRR